MKPISAEHERDLILRAQAGDNAAAGELLRAHEGFIRQLAKRGSGDFDDKLQDSRVAALKALKLFDVSITMPCVPEDVDACDKWCAQWAEDRVQEEVSSVRGSKAGDKKKPKASSGSY